MTLHHELENDRPRSGSDRTVSACTDDPGAFVVTSTASGKREDRVGIGPDVTAQGYNALFTTCIDHPTPDWRCFLAALRKSD